MKTKIQSLINIGIDANIPQTEVIKIRIMNVVLLMTLFAAFIFLAYHIFYIIIDFKFYLRDIFPLTILNLSLATVAGICLWLNSQKKYEISNLFVFSFICVYFIFITYKTNNFELIYSYFGIMLVSFFVFNKGKILLLTLLMILTSFTITKLILDFHWVEKDLNNPFISITNIMVAFGFFIVVGYLFKTENQNHIKTIEKQSQDLLAQKDEIAISNELLKDSIDYAGRIQKAILPTETQLKNIFAESFVYYVPKDVVSGDFYWLGEENDLVFWAVGDCTGHGVPGAMMSVLGMNLLTQIISENKLTNPAEILTLLDKKILNMLAEDGETTLRDGMDIALLSFNQKTNEVNFSTAQRPVWLLKKGELQTFKGSKIPVGSEGYPHKNFETNTIKVEKDDILCIFSDGITDQFDAQDSQKIGTPRLRNWIKDNQHLPLAQQKQILQNNFETWKGNIHQTDDVVFLMVKFA